MPIRAGPNQLLKHSPAWYSGGGGYWERVLEESPSPFVLDYVRLNMVARRPTG